MSGTKAEYLKDRFDSY